MDQLIRAGFCIDLLGIVVATLIAYIVVAFVFGLEAGMLPAWAKGRS